MDGHIDDALGDPAEPHEPRLWSLHTSPGQEWWALVWAPRFPSRAEHNPATTGWRDLRVDPDLAGLAAAVSVRAGMEMGRADDWRGWRPPLTRMLLGLAWHPARPLIAGLLLSGRHACPWIADCRARTVRVYRQVRAATSLTWLEPGRPPLAWCGDGRLLLLVPEGRRAADVTDCGEPLVYEARGPGYVTFSPGLDELASLAGAKVALLNPDNGDVAVLTGPMLVGRIADGAEPGQVLVQHATAADDSEPEGHVLRWSECVVDATAACHGQAGAGPRRHDPAVPAPPPRVVPVPAGPFRDERPADRSWPPARSLRVDLPGQSSPATLTVFGGTRPAGSPLLLWIRPGHNGASRPGSARHPTGATTARPADTDTLPAGAAGPPAWLTAIGSPAALLALPLRWPSDASADMLCAQITTGVETVIETLTGDLGDRRAGQVFVGGYSFGATLALLALARIPALRAAIAHSGCYNRTLTPAGFQYEHRSYWEAPEVYRAFSPLLFADRLDRPVLIVHGAEDANPATPAEQAIELYRGIIAAGGHARLVLLPGEGHAYSYLESQRTLIREHTAWLSRWSATWT
jgi:predicted esterase